MLHPILVAIDDHLSPRRWRSWLQKHPEPPRMYVYIFSTLILLHVMQWAMERQTLKISLRDHIWNEKVSKIDLILILLNCKEIVNFASRWKYKSARCKIHLLSSRLMQKATWWPMTLLRCPPSPKWWRSGLQKDLDPNREYRSQRQNEICVLKFSFSIAALSRCLWW